MRRVGKEGQGMRKVGKEGQEGGLCVCALPHSDLIHHHIDQHTEV